MEFRVRTLGQAVRLSERMRVAHRLSLYLVRARNFLVALIPRSGTPNISSISAEYVLKNISVFVRSANEGSEQNSGKIFMSGIVKSAKEDYNKYDGFLS